MKRLELYSRNMVDHHMIVDTLPILARLLFLGRLRGVRISYLQVAILLATGLQHRDVDSIAAELDLPANQVLAFFNKTIRKIAQHLKELLEKQVSPHHAPLNHHPPTHSLSPSPCGHSISPGGLRAAFEPHRQRHGEEGRLHGRPARDARRRPAR